MAKISKNQRSTTNQPKQRSMSQYGSPKCGACGELSKAFRPRHRVCKSGHVFMWKNKAQWKRSRKAQLV